MAQIPFPDPDYPVVPALRPEEEDHPWLPDDPFQLNLDEAQVRKADNDLVDGWKATSGPWFAAQGEDAALRWPEMQQALDEAVRRPLGSLDNDRQRQMYGDLAARRRDGWFDEARAHATREAQAFNEAQSQRRQALALDALARGARLGDMRSIADGERRLIGEVRGRSERQGLDSAAAEAADADARDQAHGEVVQRLVAHDPQRAQNWVNWHRGMLRDPATLDDLLRPYVAEQEADQLADQVGGQPLDLAGHHAAIDAAARDPAIAAQAKQRLTQKADADRQASEAEAKAVSDGAWAKVLDPKAKSLRVIAPADYVRLAPEEQAAVGEAVAANRRGGDPAPNPALYQALEEKARQGTLDVADVRRAWGKLPRQDWQAVDGWQRGGWRDPSVDAARPAVLTTGPIALTADMKARRNADLAALSARGIAAAQGALHPDPGPSSSDPQKVADQQISNGALTTRIAGPGETPTPFTAYFKGIAEQQPELAPDLPGYAQKAIEKLGGVDPFTQQIQNELSEPFFNTGIDKTKAILQIRDFGKARDPATGELQCPDCAAVGDKLLQYLSDYNAAHPVEAAMVAGGRFSTGAVGTVTDPFYRGAGNLVLGSINDANGDENRIGDFSLHNLYDPAAAIGKYSLRALAGQTDIGGDALSLARRAGSTIADKYHDTKDIYDKHGAAMAFDARAQELGEAAGTVGGLAFGYGEYRTARRLQELVERNFLSSEQFAHLPRTGTIDPKLIRFSQDNARSTFKPPYGSVDDFVKGLANKSIDLKSIKPIRIVEKDGLIFTLDNRRLYAFQKAGIEIPYEKLDSLPEDELRKFTTQNGGFSVKIRKGKRND